MSPVYNEFRIWFLWIKFLQITIILHIAIVTLSSSSSSTFHTCAYWYSLHPNSLIIDHYYAHAARDAAWCLHHQTFMIYYWWTIDHFCTYHHHQITRVIFFFFLFVYFVFILSSLLSNCLYFNFQHHQLSTLLQSSSIDYLLQSLKWVHLSEQTTRIFMTLGYRD